MEIACAIKKKPGKLVLTAGLIKWTSLTDGVMDQIAFSDVQGMQATPPTAAKLRIKLSSKDGRALMLEFAGASDLEQARKELQAAIRSHRESSESAQSEAKSSENSQPQKPTNSGNSASHNKPTTKKSSKKVSLEPAKLLQNLDLQRSVLRQDPALMQAFQQVVIASGALSNEQFWSLRTHLLVAAAQQQLQVRGSYNVLSTIKPSVGSDNRININLTREKIADVFDQYPLVRKAYNENVPRLGEGEFWQRFFMSKLFTVLRGEKVAQNHGPDAIFDPYIETLYELQEKQRLKRATEDSENPAPSFINVEANAKNNPETFGNDLVSTAGKGTRGLIRSMNGLSQRLLLGKRKQREAAEDMQPAGSGSWGYELRLNDLAAEPKRDKEVALNFKLALEAPPQQLSEDRAKLVVELNNQTPQSMSLDITLDSISNGSSKTEQLIQSLTPHDSTTQVGLNESVSGEVQLTHATSLEFLRHFWNAYTKSPAEAAPLREYLLKSKERLRAVEKEPGGSLLPVADALDCALSLPT